MSISYLGVRSPILKTGLLAIAAFLYFGEAQAVQTYRTLCTQYNAEVAAWSASTSRGQEMRDYKARVCDTRSPGTWDDEVVGNDISPILNNPEASTNHTSTTNGNSTTEGAQVGLGNEAPMATVANTFEIEQEAKKKAQALAETAGGDTSRLFDACKQNAGTYYSSCLKIIGTSMSSSGNLYSNLMGGYSSKPGVSCSNDVSNYQSQANSAFAVAKNQCANLQSQCMAACDAGTQLARETRNMPTSNSGQVANINTASSLCSSIPTAVDQSEKAISTNMNNIRNSCVASQKVTPSKDDELIGKVQDDETSSSNGMGLNNALAAVPGLMSAMSPQTPTFYPTGVDTSTYQSSTYSPTGLAPVVSNPTLKSSTSNSSGLGGDLTLGGPSIPEDYRKTQLQDVPQSGGGVGGVGGGGGGGPAAANNKKKNGRAGSKMDKDIYLGAYGGGAGPGARGGGGGYPDAPQGVGNGKGRPGAPGGASGSNLIGAMEQFRPTWFGRREIATVTGPDGITGPHTNLFRKVRTRYNEVPLGEFATVVNRK